MDQVIAALKDWWEAGDIIALQSFATSIFDESWRIPG
jgi:hypothetical protein